MDRVLEVYIEALPASNIPLDKSSNIFSSSHYESSPDPAILAEPIRPLRHSLFQQLTITLISRIVSENSLVSRFSIYYTTTFSSSYVRRCVTDRRSLIDVKPFILRRRVVSGT